MPGNAEHVVQLARLGEGSSLSDVTTSRDGRWLAAGTRTGAGVFDARTLQLAHFVETPIRPRLVGVASDGGTMAVVPSNSTQIWLWRAGAVDRPLLLEGHERGVNSLVFSPDGALLASGADDGRVRLWRVSDGALLRTLEGHRWLVTSVAFSPDGTVLASAAYDEAVRLWGVP